MRDKDIDFLQCPLCHSKFKLGSVWKKVSHEVLFGSLICNCDEFPVVHGVLFLFKPLNRQVIDYLRQQNFVAATLLCLTQRRKFHPDRPWMKLIAHTFPDIFSAEWMRKIGIQKFAQLVSLVMPKYLLDYYFTRDQWQDSLAIHFPLAIFLEKAKQKKKLLWLDVGSGVVNYFSIMQKAWPKMKIISIDSSFANVFLSEVFFPGKQVLRICGDAHYLQVVRPGILDVVSVVDTLQSLQAPVPFIKQIIAPGFLKKTGVLLISGLQEHLFVHRNLGIFPASRKMVSAAFQREHQPIYFDNVALSEQIRDGKVKTDQIQLKKSSSIFSYGLIWSKNLRLPKTLSTVFIPTDVRQKAKTTWDNADKMWQNGAY